jgi:hypothetical protein
MRQITICLSSPSLVKTLYHNKVGLILDRTIDLLITSSTHIYDICVLYKNSRSQFGRPGIMITAYNSLGNLVLIYLSVVHSIHVPGSMALYKHAGLATYM